jgi:hypothetical protein
MSINRAEAQLSNACFVRQLLLGIEHYLDYAYLSLSATQS